MTVAHGRFDYPQARFTSTCIRDSGDGTLHVDRRLEAEATHAEWP